MAFFTRFERPDSNVNFYGSSFVSYCPVSCVCVCVCVCVCETKQAIGLIICAKQDSTRRNKRRRFHLSFSKLRCCSQEYKSRKIHRHLVKRDRIIAMKIGKTPIFFLKKFHLLPGRSVRRVAADDYSLIWPLFQVGNFLVNCSKLCQSVYIYIYIYRLYKC